MSQPLEILKGAVILKKALGAGRVVMVMEEDEREAAELLKSKIYFSKWDDFEVRLIPCSYPRDIDRLIQKQFQAESPGRRCVVYNTATAFAAYEAVAKEKPLIERVVTLGGECLIEPRNVRLRIGTPVSEAVKACRGLLREPGRLLMGGPMRGVALAHEEMPVLAATEAVLALPPESVRSRDPEPCIQCGRCVDACPAEIMPVWITLAAEKEDWDRAADFGASECVLCGNCSYVCPSRRPMVELMAEAMRRAIVS